MPDNLKRPLASRVAVLVHNDVLKDARVRKQAATLGAAGFKVDVFGIKKAQHDYPTVIDGANLELLINTPIVRSKKLKSLVQARTTEIAIIILCMGLLGFSIIFEQPTWVLRAIMLLTLAAGFVAWRLKGNSARRQFWFTSYRTFVTVTAIAATLSLVYIGSLSNWDLAWMGFGLTVLQRLDSISSHIKILSNMFRLKTVRSSRDTQYNKIATLLADRVLADTYDIVHCHDIIALIAGGLIKRKRPNTFLIWDAHEIYEDVANAGSTYTTFIQSTIKHNQHLIDGFITINDSISAFYRDNYVLPQASVVMNATKFKGHINYDGRLHQAAGLSLNQKILIFQGGLAPHRGISLLLDAAHNLPQGWSIVMMGWGSMEKDVTKVIIELRDRFPEGRAPIALIPPAPQEELVEWTAGATLGAILYEDVGLNHLYCTPNKLWEYPNAGVPIVATDLVEMSAMINSWGTGLLLPRACKATDLIDLLRSLSNEQMDVMKKRCRKFSREMDWSLFEGKILQHYLSADNKRAMV